MAKKIIKPEFRFFCLIRRKLASFLCLCVCLPLPSITQYHQWNLLATRRTLGIRVIGVVRLKSFEDVCVLRHKVWDLVLLPARTHRLFDHQVVEHTEYFVQECHAVVEQVRYCNKANK